MSTTTSISTSYAGEFAGKYIAAAILPARTLANDLITVKQNVKFKEVVKRLSTDTLLSDGSCDFNPNGTITLTERVLQPKELQLNRQLCKSTFRNDWEAVQMGYSAYDNLPKNFADFLLAHMAEKTAQEIDRSIWVGNGSTSGQFNGFSTLIATDANLPSAQELAVIGSGLTTANVISELGKILDATPVAVSTQDDYHIYVSTNIFRLYVRALGGFATNFGAAGIDNKGSMWYNGAEIVPFEGVKLVHVPNLASNTAIATVKDNLWFGTGLLSDMNNEAKVLDMSDIDGSQNIRVIMRMTAGVQYGVAEDIVTYGITNNAN